MTTTASFESQTQMKPSFDIEARPYSMYLLSSASGNFFQHRRWLAFTGSSIAIFGTVASVETEIDRSLAGSPPDRIILQRLARLQRDDEGWSLLPAVGHGSAVLHQLRLLDSALATLAENSDFVAHGIRYGVALSSNSRSILIPNPKQRPYLNLYRGSPLISTTMSPCCGLGPVLPALAIPSRIAFWSCRNLNSKSG